MFSVFAHYPTFLVFLAIVIAAALTMAFMPLWIRMLRSSHIGQQVRADGPQSHLVKQGTPTMGGVIMLVAVAITIVLVAGPSHETFLLAGATLIAGALAAPLPALGTFGALAALYLPTMAVCMCMSVVATSWLQTESPGTLVGKVMALALMLANFATPLGQLGYGVALDLVPAWAIALAAAAATAAVAAWLARSARG